MYALHHDNKELSGKLDMSGKNRAIVVDAFEFCDIPTYVSINWYGSPDVCMLPPLPPSDASGMVCVTFNKP